MADEIFGFNSDDADELIKGLGGKERPSPGSRILEAVIHVAIVTEEITAATTTDWGKGKATLRYCPGEPGVVTEQKDYPEEEAVEFEVYTVTSSVIDVDSRIVIAREFASGKWIVIVEDC
jgi:hypothetical protein